MSESRDSVGLVRRVIVAVIIGSFAIAALGGIIVLLGAGLDETTWRILATTALVGVFSVAVLCCVALAGRRLRVVGYAGAVISVLTAALTIATVWADDGRWWFSDSFFQTLWSGLALTAAFSLASLLLLLADRRRAAVRIGLIATLGAFVVLLGLVFVVIWASPIDGEFLPRVIGVVSILAALGAVVVPVLSLLMPERGRGGSRMTPELVERLEAAASERGITVEQLVAPVLPVVWTAGSPPGSEDEGDGRS